MPRTFVIKKTFFSFLLGRQVTKTRNFSILRTQQIETNSEIVARSLRELALANGKQDAIVHALDLRDSDDLICKNLMCEHVGLSCTCKLAVVLDTRLSKSHLKRLDVCNNQLRDLPESLFTLQSLVELRVANNHLQKLSASISQLENLELLDLRSNRLKELPEEALLTLKKLETIQLSGNLIQPDDIRSIKLLEKMDFVS